MAVSVVSRYPDLPAATYDEVIASLDLDVNPPAGAILHVAGEGDHGFVISGNGELIEPDDSRVIAARTVRSGDEALKGIFRIEAGERTIFTLRSRLDRLDDYVFVICTFSTPAQRTPKPAFTIV